MAGTLQKILCVDDEEDILGIVKFALENVGHFTVEICPGGKNAVAMALEFQPQIILLDVMMPALDGPATLRQLRQNSTLADVPVIFMTAKVQKTEVNQYLSMGVCGVIPKPFDPMTLSQEVESCWRSFQGAMRSA